MDVTMPVIDGVEATRRLMSQFPDLCVIALSMHEKEDMQRAMREAGAIRYLTKDGPPDMLIAAIKSCHAKRKREQAVT
jgi:DNA-binding NarL/FixJ family response regulator